MRYETVELADAREGDEVYQAGKWTPVEGVYVFGSRRDLVKIVWQGGGSHSGPLSHMGKARRAVVEAPTRRYRSMEYGRLLCLDCSTRATGVLVDGDERAEHDAWHASRPLVLVTRLHGADVATFLADRYPATLPLVADGWTTDAAIAHVEGTCDRELCTGTHA